MSLSSIDTTAQLSSSATMAEIPSPAVQTAGPTTPRLSLLGLPYEIRLMIYEYLADGDIDTAVDISVRPQRKPDQISQFKRFFPSLVQKFKPLLGIKSCQQLQDELNEFIGQRVLFFSRHSSSFLNTPEVFGADNCLLIRRLELRMEFRMKLYHQGLWPEYLQCFVNSLPNLEWFKLYSEWRDFNDPYPPNESKDPLGSMTRFEQEQRAKLRYLSWFPIRHPKINLVILPDKSGPTWQQDETRITHCVIAQMYEENKHFGHKFERSIECATPAETVEERRDIATLEDEVVNTTLIRRLKWSQFASLHVSNYIVHPAEGKTKGEITTSEVVDADSEHFQLLDERGYMPYTVFEERGWLDGTPVNVDKLIDCGLKSKRLAGEQSTRTPTAASRASRSRGHSSRYTRRDVISTQRGPHGSRRSRGRGRGQGAEPGPSRAPYGRESAATVSSDTTSGPDLAQDNSQNQGRCEGGTDTQIAAIQGLLQSMSTSNNSNVHASDGQQSRGHGGRGRGASGRWSRGRSQYVRDSRRGRG